MARRLLWVEVPYYHITTFPPLFNPYYHLLEVCVQDMEVFKTYLQAHLKAHNHHEGNVSP
jgi:hypothetical protein